MAIDINNITTITNNRRGRFTLTNFSGYSQDQLYNLQVRGVEVGDIVYNATTADLNFWDGEKWVPQPNRNGEAVFTTPGTFTWTCPQGVQSVCVVCVGGGGAGGQDHGKLGGFGGGLGWKNNIPVTPGQAYKVIVGNGGMPKSGIQNGTGQPSYFISTNTVLGGGGRAGDNREGEQYETTYLPGGYYVGDGGGVGGGFNTYFIFAHGGAGAAGYTGPGGSFNNNMPGDSGQGGGGGAGQDGGNTSNGPSQGNGGGGVGIYGQGKDGLGGGQPGNGMGTGPGEGGSLAFGTGTNGKRGGASRPDGGFPGGGGGADHKGNSPGRGGGGAVRIVWGINRKFPATNVGKTLD